MKNKGLILTTVVLLMAVVCVFGYLTTSLAIGADMDHACNHENCFACTCLAIGKQVGVLQIVLANLIGFLAISLLCKHFSLPNDHRSLFLSTPVCRKVLLLN